jgi:class 3 adenylate cyclase
MLVHHGSERDGRVAGGAGRFRIGLHVGEVMVRKGDLFGDGVNIAARMQGLAVPGSVCLSEAKHHFCVSSPACGS